MSDYVLTNGELYHYGVKGMKWGVRKDRATTSSGSNSRKKAYDSAKKEYDRNKAIMKEYITEGNKHRNLRKRTEATREIWKRLNESDKTLRKLVEDYLDTMSDKEVKSLVKYDEEHGRRYVDARLFDININYESGIYIDDPR